MTRNWASVTLSKLFGEDVTFEERLLGTARDYGACWFLRGWWYLGDLEIEGVGTVSANIDQQMIIFKLRMASLARISTQLSIQYWWLHHQ
ncbi:hypothetical protein N7481_007655 [Penicillium waksmanii]|uniref:uncharacterized protein n=1 Tax=Penicillium waksmanii TaxID=69791 RepID=UPI002547F1E4|nr:uncharacterized protein N7481_007655 [Penicillium waksmanii]KAJ5980357.1 hypothetical protein N7481_007655 [Penicillium waksmanii]